jgi:hypothetical protein
MKNYYWDYDKYKFHLFIGEDGTRWDDEGVLQPVNLSVNGFELLNNNWGIEHNLKFLTHSTTRNEHERNTLYDLFPIVTLEMFENGMSFAICDDVEESNVIMYGEDYHEFLTWIKSCLSSKEERVKIKIDKLLNKKGG